jgi:hypothetical protein
MAKTTHPAARRPLTETADYCCTNVYPEQEYESRMADSSTPLSAQVCRQVYAGGRNSAMSFGSHLPDPHDNNWSDTDDRFGSLLSKGKR